jgi:hypothetical protein
MAEPSPRSLLALGTVKDRLRQPETHVPVMSAGITPTDGAHAICHVAILPAWTRPTADALICQATLAKEQGRGWLAMRDRYPEDYEKLSKEPGFLILRLLKPAIPAPSPLG